MAITMQQSAYQDLDFQKHGYVQRQQEGLPECPPQSQTEINRYLSSKQNYGKKAALIMAIGTLEAYQDTISDLNCFDDEQRVVRKQALQVMDDLLDRIGDTLAVESGS